MAPSIVSPLGVDNLKWGSKTFLRKLSDQIDKEIPFDLLMPPGSAQRAIPPP
jgi:hypothetical protein